MSTTTTHYPELYRVLYDHYARLRDLYSAGMQLNINIKDLNGELNLDIATNPLTLANTLTQYIAQIEQLATRRRIEHYADELILFMRHAVWCHLPHTRGNITHTPIVPLRIIGMRLHEIVKMLHDVNQNQLNTPIFKRLQTPNVYISVYNRWLDSDALRNAYQQDITM